MAPPLRILAVGAHPDDIELYAGGTIATWIGEGAYVAMLVLTDGRLGSHDFTIDPVDVAATRNAEARAAADFLGAGEIIFGGFPDGGLRQNLEAATELTAATIREIRPDIVVGHDPWRMYELHPDHRAAGTATCDGLIAAREHHAIPALRQRGLSPHRPEELWLMGTTQPDRFVDVEPTMSKKLDALGLHRSQFGHLSDWSERIASWNAEIGAERGYRAAEAFHVIAPSTS